MSEIDSDQLFDVVVVGAGTAGIGVAAALRQADIHNFVVLERETVAASFDAWPAETRLITPSFPTNSFGMLDLNSVALGVSPGYSLESEHPTGAEYAAHLRAVADFFKLPIREGEDVKGITRSDDSFRIEASSGPLLARHVIWAAGEFQYPRRFCFTGSNLCRHTATIERFSDLEGDDFIVIGGYESGIDAAFHLAWYDKRIRVFDRSAPWESTSSDPSIALSPFTLERMREDWFCEQVELFPDTPITAVERAESGYRVIAADGTVHTCETAPLWAGGFEGSHMLLTNLFELRSDGFPKLTDQDESTIAPGLFLCGPSVRHDNHIFCFIYKYRQRFAVVARAIANDLGLEAHGLETYRSWGMYLDDLSTCGERCVC